MTRPRGGRGLPSDRGFALVVVLPVLALLLLTVGEFAATMRVEAVAAANFQAWRREAWLAEAGYQRAVAEILPDAVAHELDAGGLLAFRRTALEPARVPERLDVALGDARFSYRITDETARLNVNRLSAATLDRLLAQLDVEKATRDTIVDSILDWRDANEEHRLNGAESDFYLAQALPHRSKNADFDDVEELRQVRGVTPQLLDGRPEAPGLAEYLTVVGTGAVNVNTASRVVLRALGLADAEVELLVGRRPYAALTQLPPALRRGAQRIRSDTFRIEAWAGGPTPAGRVLVAVVQRTVDGVRGVHVVPLVWRWTERGRPAAPGTPRGIRSPGP
jgi:general secretion pathway protein K